MEVKYKVSLAGVFNTNSEFQNFKNRIKQSLGDKVERQDGNNRYYLLKVSIMYK